MTDDKEPVVNKIKGFKAIPSDISAARTSPTIVRQELLSHFRMINRQCFTGQLAEPAMHMDHAGELSAPMRYWNNAGRPTISVCKRKLLALTPIQLFPELLEMVVLHWIWSTSKEVPTKEHKDYAEKLVYVQAHAKDSFTTQEQ